MENKIREIHAHLELKLESRLGISLNTNQGIVSALEEMIMKFFNDGDIACQAHLVEVSADSVL